MDAGQAVSQLLTIAGWQDDGLDVSIGWHDAGGNIFLEEGANVGITNPGIELRNIFIGRASYMLGGGMLSPNTIIGRYCSLAYNSSVGSGRHAMEWISTGRLPPPKSKIPDLPPPPYTIVGHDVWIGIGATVIGGCRVGHGACIGAGAVVTRDVPPYAVVGGTPARLIRMRFPDEIIADLLETKWWTLPEDTIAQMPYHDVRACLEFLYAIREG